MPKSKSKGPKVYAVARGRAPGIYSTWSECQAQTSGFGGAVFKSFGTRGEAQAFLRANGNSSSSKTSSSPAPSTASTTLPGGGVPDRKRPADNDARRSSRRKKTTEQRRERSSPSDSKFRLRITIHFDGGSRGNPGLAGAGAEVIMVDDDSGSSRSTTTTHSIREFCGTKETNNYAEYHGLLAGLEKAKSCVVERYSSRSRQSAAARPLFQLRVYGDSNLIIQQLRGAWQCRHANIRPLFQRSRRLIDEMRALDAHSEVLLEHVYREQNKTADALANEAMDQRRSWTTSAVDGPGGDEKSEAAAAAEKKENDRRIAASSKGEVIDVDASDGGGKDDDSHYLG